MFYEKNTVLLTSHTILLLQSIPVLNGLNKSIAIEKMKFFESLFSFPDEIDKKEQIQIFCCLIINSLSPASRWHQHPG